MKPLLYFLIFLLSCSLALAVTVVTDKTEYASGEQVQITVDECIGTSIVKIINPGSTLADIKAGENNWVTLYNTLSDSAAGKYTATVSCTNGATETFFCVNSAGCLGTATGIATGTEVQTETNETAAICISQWDCSWSYCHADLKQVGTCTDNRHCRAAKEELRDCSQCAESWVCSDWSACFDSQNQRNCVDEHGCGTFVLKPALQKYCDEEIPPGPAPAYISSTVAPPYYPEPAEAESFWDKYLFYIISIPIILILTAVIVLLVLHYLKSREEY